MGSGDVVTNRSAGLSADLSTDLWVERLEPGSSASAMPGKTPGAEVRRKARRRPRQDQDDEPAAEGELSSSLDFRGGEPEHKIDSLA